MYTVIYNDIVQLIAAETYMYMYTLVTRTIMMNAKRDRVY